MKEIRNPDGRLVCCIDEVTGSVEILEKGWMTTVRYDHDGKVEVVHSSRKSNRG